MKLKCIGGPNHQEYRTVPNDYYKNDLVRLATYPKIAINETSSADSVTVDYNFYIISVLRWKEENRSQPTEFKFLRFKGISMAEALRIALVY